jgi:hypothetical protein
MCHIAKPENEGTIMRLDFTVRNRSHESHNVYIHGGEEDIYADRLFVCRVVPNAEMEDARVKGEDTAALPDSEMCHNEFCNVQFSNLHLTNFYDHDTLD